MMKVKSLPLKMINYSKGFTLVEILIVVAILAILSGVVIVVLQPFAQIQKANDGRRKADISEIQKALETYYQDNGHYPGSDAQYNIKRNDGTSVTAASPAFPPYINVLPSDPNPAKKYVYYAPPNAGGQTYYIYAAFDRSADPGVCNGGNACSSLSGNGIPAGSCGGTCNYGVSSPNVSP